MAKTLTSTASCGVTWVYTNSSALGNTAITNGLAFQAALATGTGAAQADLLYIGQITVGASATNDLDLAGSLADVFGATLTFARVKAVLMVPDSTNTASGFKVGNAAANQFVGWFGAATHTESADKTGAFFKFRSDATGWVVTPGTGDLLRVTNLDGANSLVLNVAVVGASA